jgi:sn-glycerol 3-phosphate transport system ATP-binding protein
VSSIQRSGIAKSWGESTALHAISLRIEQGSFYVLLGPSGCGKSTSLRILAGLETATAGQILIDGSDVTNLTPSQRGIAMVFQNYALFPHLTVAENITFGLSVRKTPVAETASRLQETAALLGLGTLPA